MTDKEKARAYDEALEKARARYDKEPTDGYVGYANQILKELFPTLTESDDERIRKEMVDYFSQYKEDGIRGVDITPWIAYLEKQEIFSKNGAGCYYYDADGSYTFIGLPGFGPIEDIKLNGERPKTENKSVGLPGAGLCVEKQKEQKPILEVFGFKVGDAVRLKDGDGRKHIIKSFEEVEGLHGPNFYHVEFEDNLARDGIYPGEEYPNGYYTQMEKFEEEQKPADLSEMMVHKEPYIAPVPTPMVADEQKPVEWSDEDSDNLERVDNYLWMLDDYVGDDCAMPQGKTDKIRGNIQGILSPWLKSLPERFNLQPKQEWSEEDDLNCNRIIRFLEPHKTFFPTKETKEDMQNWLKNRLKSLRPQYHGDVTMTEAYKMGLEAGKASSWKPSKEQIKYLLMLADYFESEGGISNAKTLREFSEQLEKLI